MTLFGKKTLAVVGLVAAFILAAGIIGTVAWAQQPNKIPVLIGFNRQPGPAEEALVRRAGGSIKYTYHLVPAIAASLPQNAIDALRKNPNIARIELDGLFHKIDYTSELNNTWGVKQIGGGTVHTNGNTGANIKVAIIDTGIDYTHPDLGGCLGSSCKVTGGYDFVNKDNDPMDDDGHGTHVAGTVAAIRDGLGVVGVAPGAKLYGLKVLNANGSGSFSDVIKALEWSVANGIQVTNNSYGSGGDPGATVKAAFDNAYYNHGMIHVAAAGNSGNSAGKNDSVGYPAKYDSVVAVAATNSSNSRASWSSTGPAVEIAAPGVSINSTKLGGGYVVFSGTSMASPHVAGVAALVLGANPTLANAQVRQILTDTAQDLGVAGKDNWYGYGLVKADAAVAAATPAPTPGIYVTLGTDKSSYASIDTTAILTAAVKDESNNPVAGLLSSAFSTVLAPSGGSPSAQSVAFSETGTPGTYTGNLSLTGLSANSYTVEVTATKSGVSGTGSAVFTVQAAATPAATETVLASSINPSSVGQSVTITSTTTSSGSAVGEGSVTFKEGETVLAGPIVVNAGGQASFSTSGLVAGPHVITAYYAGTTNFAAGDGNMTQTVSSTSPTVSVQSITYSTNGGKNNDKHLNITVTIWDSLNNPVGGAVVSIELYRGTNLAATGTGTTGTSGGVTFVYNNAPFGNYTTKVTNVAASGYTWDGVTPPNSYPEP